MKLPPKANTGYSVDQTITRDEWDYVEAHGVEIEGIDFEGFLNVWHPNGGEPMRIDADALWVLLSKHFGNKYYNPAEDE
ncbi:hypothetical protein [Yoonia algicola]|uniref:Uncharacterized protein n=1 Tax=Yoonia algicola TaxID=3137368 RepID=A0AAN0MBP3_9RHOB